MHWSVSRMGDIIQLPFKSRGKFSLTEMPAALEEHIAQTRTKYLPAGFTLKVLIRFSFFDACSLGTHCRQLRVDALNLS